MRNTKAAGKLLAGMLSLGLLFSGVSPMYAADSQVSASQSSSEESSSQDDLTTSDVNHDMPVLLVPDTDSAQSSRTGTLTIQLEDSLDKRSKEGVEFAIVKVADVVDGEYQMLDDFKESEVDLNTIETANALEEAASSLIPYAKPQTTVKTNSEGTAVAEDLSVGVYLVYVTVMADYDYVAPALIAIPTYDEEAGDMAYDLVMQPKHEALPKLAIEKVDENGTVITGKVIEFTAYSDEKMTEQVNVYTVSPDSGIALIDPGFTTLWIKETKEPEGYVLNTDTIKVSISSDGMYVNDQQVTPDENHVYHMQFVNKSKSAVVKEDSAHTGSQVGNQMLMYGIAALGALAVLIALIFKVKSSKKS